MDGCTNLWMIKQMFWTRWDYTEAPEIVLQYVRLRLLSFSLYLGSFRKSLWWTQTRSVVLKTVLCQSQTPVPDSRRLSSSSWKMWTGDDCSPSPLWSPQSEGLTSLQPLLTGIPLLPTIRLVTVPLCCVLHGVLIITEQEERVNEGPKEDRWAFGMNHKRYRGSIAGYSIKLAMCHLCRKAALHHASFWLVFP